MGEFDDLIVNDDFIVVRDNSFYIVHATIAKFESVAVENSVQRI